MRRLISGFSPGKKQEPDDRMKAWVRGMVASLEKYDETQLITREALVSIQTDLLANAQDAGYTTLLIKQLMLKQLFFAALVMGHDPNPTAAWATEILKLTKDQVETTLAEAQQKRTKAMPEFVSEAPQSVQGSGATMAEVWNHHKVPVEFISANESGLRHYSLRFKLPIATSINKVEPNLRDALSHGGFHPGIKVLFTHLPFGEFEVHIPKESGKCQAMSFADYLLRLIDYQPRPNDPRVLEHFVRSVTNHFYPQANLLKSPEIPIGIDIYGKPSFVNYGAGGLIVGAPNSGKSTNIKLVITLLTLMLPPELFKFVGFDFKDVTLERFTEDGWRNPWTLGSVITSKNAGSLSKMIKALRVKKKNRADLIGGAKCESWLKYNAKNPAKPIPFSPIFIDEAPKMRNFIGKAEADDFIDEVSSSWRFVGMPLVLGAQYASENTSIPPMVRQALECKTAFHSSKSCAELAFEEKELVAAVQQLLGGGDFVSRSAGSLLAVHGQGFDAPEDLVNQILSVLKPMYAETPLEDYLFYPNPDPEKKEDPWEAEDA